MNIQLFDFSVDLLKNLTWRVDAATVIQSILQQKQDWYTLNQTEFWQNWMVDVFDLQTANDFGLSVWSIILNQPLQIDAGPDPDGKPIWGFGSETITPNTYVNFNNGNFSNGGSNISLSTEEKRLILKLRYFQLVSRAAIPEVNSFLQFAFEPVAPPGGQVYILDPLDMTIRVVFTFYPSRQLLLFIQTFDLIPRLQGVGISYLFTLRETLGFGEFNQNFEIGTFLE